MVPLVSFVSLVVFRRNEKFSFCSFGLAGGGFWRFSRPVLKKAKLQGRGLEDGVRSTFVAIGGCS